MVKGAWPALPAAAPKRAVAGCPAFVPCTDFLSHAPASKPLRACRNSHNCNPATLRGMAGHCVMLHVGQRPGAFGMQKGTAAGLRTTRCPSRPSLDTSSSIPTCEHGAGGICLDGTVHAYGTPMPSRSAVEPPPHDVCPHNTSCRAEPISGPPCQLAILKHWHPAIMRWVGRAERGVP